MIEELRLFETCLRKWKASEVYQVFKLIKATDEFIAYIMDGGIFFTVYWALSITPSTFFTQTRFHVPVKEWTKHTPSSWGSHHRFKAITIILMLYRSLNTNKVQDRPWLFVYFLIWTKQYKYCILAEKALRVICRFLQYSGIDLPSTIFTLFYKSVPLYQHPPPPDLSIFWSILFNLIIR